MNAEDMMNDPTDCVETLACNAKAKAESALRASKSYVRRNPLLITAGILAFGVAIGAILGSRANKNTESGVAAREFIDDVVAQLSHRFGDLKKQSTESCSSFADQVQETGKKLKWW